MLQFGIGPEDCNCDVFAPFYLLFRLVGITQSRFSHVLVRIRGQQL